MENIEKGILKTSLLTLGALITIVLIFAVVMSVFFPKNMYRFCSSLGFDNWAYNYAKMQYDKSKDINDLHTLIYSAYKIENDDAIISYTEILVQSPHYKDFIEYINKLNISSTEDFMAQIVMSNENNYLKNRYVRSLCNCNKFDSACDYVLQETVIYQDWSLPNRTEWLLSSILEYQKNQFAPNYSFLKNMQSDGHTLIYLFENYIDRIITAYDDLKADSSIIENGEFLKQALSYDLSNYLNHILFLNGKVDLEIHDFSYYQNVRNSL